MLGIRLDKASQSTDWSLRPLSDRQIGYALGDVTHLCTIYEMLLEDYLFGFLFWWSNLVSLGVTVLPMFDQPEGQRMKRLWGQGLVWMLIAMTDHDCLSLVRRIQSEVKG